MILFLLEMVERKQTSQIGILGEEYGILYLGFWASIQKKIASPTPVENLDSISSLLSLLNGHIADKC